MDRSMWAAAILAIKLGLFSSTLTSDLTVLTSNDETLLGHEEEQKCFESVCWLISLNWLRTPFINVQQIKHLLLIEKVYGK